MRAGRVVRVVAASALFALGNGAGTARAAEYGASVSAIDNVFAPEVVRIQPGEDVEWTMDGRSPHTVEADDGSWGSGDLAPGDEFTRRFDQPGVYTYFCRYHGSPGVGMTGTVLVGDVPLPGPAGDVGPGREPVPRGFADTVRVPADAPTIQEAVDRAEPGGMVLISPGVYDEDVTVTTPYLTIRGTDRNGVVIEGKFERAIGIHVIEADGVSIENLTVRNHLLNGVQWSGVHGYWASYVTAYNNGDYGIYAYDSDWGRSTTRTRAARPIAASTSGSATRATRSSPTSSPSTTRWGTAGRTPAATSRS